MADVKNSVIRIFFVHGVRYRSRKANEFMVYNCIPSILPGPKWHMRYHHPYLVNWSSLTTYRRQVLEVQTQESVNLFWQMEDGKVIGIITEFH